MVDAETRRRFGTLVAAAFVDGVLADAEKLVLHRKATEMDIPIRLMNEMISQGEHGGFAVTVPPTPQGKEKLLADLIDVACADGRLEAPEHHLLAKFAAHVGLPLADLRVQVRQRMEKRSPSRRIEAPPLPPEPPPAPTPPPPRPGTVPLEATVPAAPTVPDIPPVTLQLIKQAIVFESEGEALGYVERMMGVTRLEAQRIIQAVRAAFPDLKAGSGQPKRK